VAHDNFPEEKCELADKIVLPIIYFWANKVTLRFRRFIESQLADKY
jgi:hypothetical protein